MTAIALGIDIDTTDVVASDAAFDRLKGTLQDTQGRLTGVGTAAGGADRGLRLVADSTRQAETRTAAAVAQYQKLSAVWVTLAAVAGGTIVSGLVGLSDEYTEITNKLKVVAGEQENVNGLFDRLIGIANDTRSPIDAIATLYQRAALNAKELGASQSDLIQFTENVGRALAIQGGSAAAASGALLQLSQALGGGVVHAEEFNSILEGALPVAQAAAKGIDAAGGSVAKLRSLVIAGKVSSDEFFTAILSQSKELEATFAKTTPTISQAFTVLHNSMVDLGGETQGIMSGVASVILFVAENLERLAVYAATAGVAFATKFAAGMAIAAVQAGTLAGAMAVLRGAIITTGIGALVVLAGEMAYQFLELVKATGGWGEALSLLGEVASGVWEGIKTSASAIPVGLEAIWEAVKAGFIRMAQGIAKTWADFLHGFADKVPDIPAFEDTLLAVHGAAVKAGSSVYELGAAADAAAGRAEALKDQAAGLATSGFEKAVESVAKLRDKVSEVENGVGGASGMVAKLPPAIDTATGSAKKLADELARAKEVLSDQVAEHQRVLDLLHGAGGETDYVAKEAEKLSDALRKSGVSMDDFLKSAGMTRDEYSAMLRETERVTEQLDRQKQAAQDVATTLSKVAFGQIGIGEGAGDIISTVTNGAFGAKLEEAMDSAVDKLSGALAKAMEGLGSGAGLSGDAMTYVGTGIGMAAVGAINGNVQQIGSGIGSAVGGAIGSSLTSGIGGALGALGGPVGMVLGGAIGGFITKLFSNESTWETVDGTAFAGTSYAQNASVRVNSDNPDPTADARLAHAGTVKLLENFNRELVQFVEASGGTLRAGAERVVKEAAAVRAITGVIDAGDVPGSGAEAQQLAAEISAKVAEIMGIAGQIAAKAGPPLTQAQRLWRETQQRFSEENVAILRDLGFSAREIAKAQQDVRRDLVQGFEGEMLDSLVDTGRASKEMLREWRRSELQELQERREQAIRTAREIGASLDIVRANFNAQGKDIEKEFRDMLADMVGAVGEARDKVSRMERLQYRGGVLDELVSDGADNGTLKLWLRTSKAILEEQRRDAVAEARRLGVDVTLIRRLYNQKLVDLEKQYGDLRASAAQEAAERAQAVIDRLTDKQNRIDSRRAEVMQELTRRAEQARQAEQALSDARASLASGDLAPGGPMDRLAELQRQFAEAIKAAKGGDVDAASRAGSLASSLLQQGQQVYASSGSYTDLFQSVNTQLLAAQGGFDARADRIESRLDAATFTSVTEKHTAALLRAFARLDERLADVSARIERQTNRLERVEQTRRVGGK